MTNVPLPGDRGGQPAGASDSSKQSKSLNNPPIWLAVVLWALCTDWVFQWHRWFLPGINYPWSNFGRFGILVAATVCGLIPAFLLKKAVRYMLLVVFTTFIPLLLAVFAPMYLLTVPSVIYKYPRRVFGALSAVLRWFSSSLVGKAVSFVSVIALTWALPRAQSVWWIRAELAALAVTMALLMAGMLHLASSPLSYVDSLHRFIFRVVRMIVAFVTKLGARSPTKESLLKFKLKLLVGSSGFAQAMMEELGTSRSSWRYFVTFLFWLGVAFVITVLAFASAYFALDRLVPTGLWLFDTGYSACVSLSFSVITTLAVPERLLYPLSVYSAVVFAEVAVCFYLVAVTVWAFAAGAQRNTETMVEELKKMWSGAVNANIAELELLGPAESWLPQIQQSRDSWLKRLR